jgi:hypothetical protein
MSIPQSQRFRKGQPCPSCGGHDDDTRGAGERCYGFISDDATYAHCTREEYAGNLTVNPKSQTYAHKLTGDCKCGVRHTEARTSTDEAPNEARQKPRDREPSQTYDYVDEAGQLRYQVCRYTNPKGFKQRRPSSKGGWTWNIDGVPRVLYRLPQPIEPVTAGRMIFIPEGEKDVDFLVSLGLDATTNSGGAGKFPADQATQLTGAMVVILEDHDEAGRTHTADLFKKLSPVAKWIKRIAFPELPEHGDVSDWLKAGHTIEELLPWLSKRRS